MKLFQKFWAWLDLKPPRDLFDYVRAYKLIFAFLFFIGVPFILLIILLDDMFAVTP